MTIERGIFGGDRVGFVVSRSAILSSAGEIDRRVPFVGESVAPVGGGDRVGEAEVESGRRGIVRAGGEGGSWGEGMREARRMERGRRLVREGETGGGKERKSYNPSLSVARSSNSSNSASTILDFRFGCRASAFDLEITGFDHGASEFANRGDVESDLDRLVGVEGLETVDCFDQRCCRESVVEAELRVVDENFEKGCWSNAAHSGGAAEESELEDENLDAGRRRAGCGEGAEGGDEGVETDPALLMGELTLRGRL